MDREQLLEIPEFVCGKVLPFRRGNLAQIRTCSQDLLYALSGDSRTESDTRLVILVAFSLAQFCRQVAEEPTQNHTITHKPGTAQEEISLMKSTSTATIHHPEQNSTLNGIRTED